MLKVVFNRDGSIKAYELPTYVIKGSGGELTDSLKLEVAVEGLSLASNYIVKAYFKLPNGTTNHILLNSNLSNLNLYGFDYTGGKYGYLTTYQTYYEGTVKASIQITSATDETNVLYTFPFNIVVNPSTYDPDDEDTLISNAQFKNLEQNIGFLNTAIQEVMDYAKLKTSAFILKYSRTIAEVKRLIGSSSGFKITKLDGTDITEDVSNGDYDNYTYINADFNSNESVIQKSSSSSLYVIFETASNYPLAGFIICTTAQLYNALLVGSTIKIVENNVPDRWFGGKDSGSLRFLTEETKPLYKHTIGFSVGGSIYVFDKDASKITPYTLYNRLRDSLECKTTDGSYICHFDSIVNGFIAYTIGSSGITATTYTTIIDDIVSAYQGEENRE